MSSNGITLAIYNAIQDRSVVLAHHPLYLPRQYTIFTPVNEDTIFAFAESKCTSKVLALDVFTYRTFRPPNMLSQQFTTAAAHSTRFVYVYGVSERAYPVNGQRFDMVSNTWVLLQRKPLGVSIRFICMYLDRLYLLSAVPLNAIEVYFTLTDRYIIASIPVSGRTILSFQYNSELYIFKEDDVLVRWKVTGTQRITGRKVECPRERLNQGVVIYQGKAIWLFTNKEGKCVFDIYEDRFRVEKCTGSHCN